MKLAVRIAASCAVAVLAAFALYCWTVIPVRCARREWKAARSLNATGHRSDLTMRREAQQVRYDLDGCGCAPTHDLYFTLGNASTVAGEPRRAMAEYARALELDRRPETYFQHGMSALDAYDRETAIASLTRACAFDPARLGNIDYEAVRAETARRIRATYGDDWLR